MIEIDSAALCGHGGSGNFVTARVYLTIDTTTGGDLGSGTYVSPPTSAGASNGSGAGSTSGSGALGSTTGGTNGSSGSGSTTGVGVAGTAAISLTQQCGESTGSEYGPFTGSIDVAGVDLDGGIQSVQGSFDFNTYNYPTTSVSGTFDAQ